MSELGPAGTFAACGLRWPEVLAELSPHRRRVRQAVRELLGEPPFDDLPPLMARTVYTADDGGYWRQKVLYGTPRDDVVYAWLLVPKELEGRTPAVICLAGSFMTPNWGKDGPAGLAGPWKAGDPEAYGRDLARRGYVVLCPDYPCCGERTTPGLKSHDTTDLDRRFPMWTRVGLSAWDVSRAVDFLVGRSEVDGRRIGCMGWSQGGQMSVIGAALDERLAAVVSVCGWGPLAGVGGERAANWARSYNLPRLRPHLEVGMPLPVDFDHLVAAVAPRPFLDVRARGDDVFPNVAEIDASLERVRAVYGLAGAAPRFEVVWLPGGHGYSSGAARETEAWLHRWLWESRSGQGSPGRQEWRSAGEGAGQGRGVPSGGSEAWQS
ncbi:MAG: alpha/beta fold hydrolase [Gemmatimonadota bacterium]